MFISFCLSLFIFGSAFCPKCCWCFRQPFLADIADPVALANLLNQKVIEFNNLYDNESHAQIGTWDYVTKLITTV
jgi:hypothetical protein